MSELRPFALVRTGDQWVRSSFEATYLDLFNGIVELAWTTTTAESDAPAPAVGAGLAFDNECRLYHSLPSAGRVERILWAALDPSAPVGDQPAPVNLLHGEPVGPLGDFTPTGPELPLREPRGLAVDVNDRLFVAESAADLILVYDLWSERLLQRLPLPTASRPTDLAVHGIDVYAVLAGAGQVVRLSARSPPSQFTLPHGCTQPSRIAVSPSGHISILAEAGTPTAHVWFSEMGFPDFSVSFATDVEWESESVVVIARQPGADFLRYQIGDGKRDQLPSLRARGYDGLGIVAVPEADRPSGNSDNRSASSPSQRIGFWTASGFRTAALARLVYERLGRVTTFRLDSGAYQTVWGRLFVDACIPDGTAVRVHYIVLDETADAPLARVAPSNVKLATLPRPDLSPPMPPASLVPELGAVVQTLHRRESGRELPWTQPAVDDPFVTYEAPINALAGRYLWITLELRGNTRVSPKIKCIRAEHPSHDYLRRLPKTFSRDPQPASFLLRYLAMFEGFLGEAEARAVDRDLLLDARSAPDEVLPWLASFLGLVLDERWANAPAPRGKPAVDARRKFIKDAAWLFRYRGTPPGLTRFIELYVGVPVVIFEHFRLRGLGAAVLGDTGTAFSSSIVGYGFRVGGAIATETGFPIAETIQDAFRTHAHRFTVIIPAVLTREQREVVNTIIEFHRPAHTVFDVCIVGAGMRIGRALLLGISSLIGPTGGFSTLQLGGSALGRGTIVGRPESGVRVGSSTLGNTAVG
jgi:phage tail-like protein